jgi:transglutaminase-like putative cysteine protease
MKRMFFLLCLLLVIPFSYADEVEDIIYRSESVTLTHSIHSEFYVSYQSSQAQLEHLKAYVGFFPRDSYRQTVYNVETQPTPDHQNTSTIVFVWNEPVGSNRFSIDGRIQTYNTFLPVEKKIPFPIRDLPENIKIYTQEAPNIDITNDIRRQANLIAQGKDDLFIVTHDIADWVENNIEYSLNTVTAEAALPASWVFQQRQGVCDELTLLYIAMLRSIGIPARMASGISY